MTKMEQLKAEAKEAAILRGHRLGRFKASIITPESPKQNSRAAAVALCEICNAAVLVDSAPPPGEPEIMGEAINKDCRGIDQEWHETA